MHAVAFYLVMAVLTGSLLVLLKRLCQAVFPHDPMSPEQYAGRLGELVDDETRQRLHERMRSAR